MRLSRVEFITETGEQDLKEIRELFKKMEQLLETRCKYCNSRNVVKNGKSPKGIQNWLCRDCGRAFVDNKALPRMATPTRQIGSAIYNYYTGSSLNEIRGYFDQQYETLPSDATIYNWVTRFSKIAIDEAKKYTPKVGRKWVADETVLRINGRKYWLFDIIDYDTRFLLATYLSPNRGIPQAKQLMIQAKAKAGKSPDIILTDGLKSYIDAIELVFGSDTEHIQSKPFTEKELSANVIERMQGSIKARTKVMRGFKTPESARLILDGWLVYYNFFRPHESLNDRTPAEAAGITRFPYKNWLEVVNSQLPTANMDIKNEASPVVISSQYKPKKGFKKVTKRRITKRQLREKVEPEITTFR